MQFRYKSKKFHLNYIPTCNLCNSKLDIKKGYSIYNINKCTNEKCESNLKGRSTKLKAFLPKSLYNEYIKSLSERLVPTKKEYWIKKGFSERESLEILSKNSKRASQKVKKNRGRTKKQRLEEGYTESDLKDLYSPPNTLYHWIKKGYTEKEAKKKVSEWQSIQSKKVDRTNKSIFNTCIEYWIKKGFSEEEAKKKILDRQRTFTLEKCIEKYGEAEGLKRFKKRQKVWLESLRKNFEQEGDGRSNESKWANILIKKICQELNIEIPKKEKWINGGDIRCSYDFTYKNKIIEFNGDYWHANPRYYKAEDKIHNLTAQERWNLDLKKLNLAESKGYDVYTLWESDYFKSPKKEIKKILKFLNNE